MRIEKCRMPLMLLIGAVLLLGCGGGSGSSDGGGGVIMPATCISFQPEGAAGSSKVAATQGSGSQCGMVEVELVMSGVTDVFTVSFDVSYDSSKAQYAGYSLNGSRIGSDGAGVDVLETTGAGQLSLGITRIGTTTGIDFTATATVVKLMFSKVSGTAMGAGSFDFSRTVVTGSETPPQVKPGIQWLDGSFMVR